MLTRTTTLSGAAEFLAGKKSHARKLTYTPRLGLCCIFREAPIAFRTRQAVHLKKFNRQRQMELLSESIMVNCRSLLEAVTFCSAHQIGSFRVNSRFFPLKTHPEVGYGLAELPDHSEILTLLDKVRRYAETNDIRLTFHPDQFILLSSPRIEVIHNSIEELYYHAELAELIGADVIMIHGGGAYGDKKSTLQRLSQTIAGLPASIRSKLALENDDRVYTPQDLLPVCEKNGIPLVYDVHHHRCLADGITVKDATDIAIATWNREPLFHLSSPKLGWNGSDPKPHSDMIDPGDFPECWRDKAITLEIEAKAKEIAIEKLIKDLRDMDFPAKRLQKQ